MASVAANTPVSTPKTPFERTMESLNLPKQDINTLIMDFLVKEGYPAAAQRFAEEANIEVKEDDTFINERVQIRDAIFRGDITNAMEEINEINPELNRALMKANTPTSVLSMIEIVAISYHTVQSWDLPANQLAQLLDKDKSLNFSLHRLQLIEKIKAIFAGPESAKQDLVIEAIQYAQQHLSPYTERNQQFKTDLERAMALLLVPREAWQNSRTQPPYEEKAFGALADLIDPGLRVEVAKDVNAAILRQQSRTAQTHISRLLSTRAWSEELAREKGIQLPESMGVGLQLASSSSERRPQQQLSSSSQRSSNGHTDGGGDTQMTESGGGGGGGEETATSDPVARYTNIP